MIGLVIICLRGNSANSRCNMLTINYGGDVFILYNIYSARLLSPM